MAAGGQDEPTVVGEQSDDVAKDRVLDTAVAHFSAAGFSNPAFGQVARAAHISAEDMVGLFENEGTLRQACDEYVLRSLVGWAHEKPRWRG